MDEKRFVSQFHTNVLKMLAVFLNDFHSLGHALCTSQSAPPKTCCFILTSCHVPGGRDHHQRVGDGLQH